MSKTDRKPYVIRTEAPCYNLTDAHRIATETGEPLGETISKITQAGIEAACEHALRRAMREVLPQVALELDLEEGKEQFIYEYEGVPFRVTVERSHWNVMLCTEVAFDVGDYIEWLKGRHKKKTEGSE